MQMELLGFAFLPAAKTGDAREEEPSTTHYFVAG